MGVDNRIETVAGLKNVSNDELMKEHHDLPTTRASIQEILAGGTPNWVKWPEDYKQYAREAFLAEKEISDEMAEQYQIEDQKHLTNEKARKVNSMSTDQFIYKLRTFGIKCFTVYNGMPGTLGLWCIPPKRTSVARYVCFVQDPAMWEWSVLRTDRHNIPIGEKFRGWRTVIIELIKKDILTEYQAHQIFGHPSQNYCFARYQRSLWEIRNGKKFTDVAVEEKDVL